MRKIALWVLSVAMTLIPSPVLAREGILERIERFLEILESSPSYFNSQYYDFFEGELTIVEKLCGDDLELPIKDRKLCADLRNERFHENSDAPSLLLLWLHTKLPTNPTISILKAECNSRFSQCNIAVKLDNIIAVFHLFDTGSSHSPLVVYSINGVYILDILDKDIQNGLTASSLLHGFVQR